MFLCLNDAIARPFLCSRAIYPFGHCPGTAPGTDTGTLSPHCARHCRKKATANEGQAACCFATFPDAGATPSFFEKKKKQHTNNKLPAPACAAFPSLCFPPLAHQEPGLCPKAASSCPAPDTCVGPQLGLTKGSWSTGGPGVSVGQRSSPVPCL